MYCRRYYPENHQENKGIIKIALSVVVKRLQGICSSKED